MDYRFISRWWITVIFVIFCKTFVIFSHYKCLTKFDRRHWLLRPQEGGGPLLLPPRSLQGPPSQPGPLTGDPSASSTHGFSSSNRRSQWCHTKVGPCPVIVQWLGWSILWPTRPGLLGHEAEWDEVALPVPSPHLLFFTCSPGGTPPSHVRPWATPPVFLPWDKTSPPRGQLRTQERRKQWVREIYLHIELRQRKVSNYGYRI